MSAPTPGTDPDRLQGWKEIAAFLGKGVRTAQRWEREFGMPVHRLGASGGEVVFAWRSEISRWMMTAAHSSADAGDAESEAADSTAPPGAVMSARAADANLSQSRRDRASSRSLWLLAVAALAAAVAAGAWLGGHLGVTAGTHGQPAGWRVRDGQLHVLDEDGRTLWTFRPAETLDPRVYTRHEDGRDSLNPSPVIVEDLDGDGSREVVFSAAGVGATKPVVYVLNADGAVRFTFAAPTSPFRFGSRDYQADWTLEGTWTTRDSSGQRSIWLPYRHRPYFPSLLVQLDPYGRVLSQYMSNGYVVHVTAARWKGADVVLVGAANNESRGGSLAIFEGRTVRGSAPAEDPKYRCTSCQAGGPDVFLTFPRACLSLRPGETSRIGDAWIGRDDTVWAEAYHGMFLGRPDVKFVGSVIYTLDRDLVPRHVEINGSYVMLHRQQLEAAGLVDHQVGPVDEAMVQPVRIFRDGSFEDLPRAEVETDR